MTSQLAWATLVCNSVIKRGNAIQAKKAMSTVTSALQHKDLSIWVFPEGTRGHGKGLAHFKKGAFQMAISAGVPIVPICVNNYVRSMDLRRWESGRVELRALPPIPTEGLTHKDIPDLMARCHEQMKVCIDELDRMAGTEHASAKR